MRSCFKVALLFENKLVLFLAQDNQALGIGSGSTIVFAVEKIGMKLLVYNFSWILTW